MIKSNMFFMTDYPHIPGDKPASLTFHPLDENHLKSIKYILSKLKVFMTYDKQHYQSFFNATGIPNLEIYDNNNNTKMISVNAYDDIGILGIIDQLIAIKSDYYLLAKPNKCGRNSTYSLNIINQRKKNNSSANIFDYWS